MTRALVITGANGFVGAHVAALADNAGHRVIAIGREPEPSALLAPHVSDYLTADLYSSWPVQESIDAVVHLAGLAAVGPSFQEPQPYIELNSGIMTRMCESLLDRRSNARVVVVSSGAVYAPPNGPTPVTESSPVAFTSPYAIAKLLVESQARYYATRGLDTIIARPFNHIGPGQGAGFLVPDLFTAVRDLPPGESITVGNLDTARDYTDVRDVARAYITLALADSHNHDVYNVATGVAQTGRDVLTAIANALGRPIPPTTIDPSRLRPNDPPIIIGDATRLCDEHRWVPTIPWTQSIVEYVTQVERAPGR